MNILTHRGYSAGHPWFYFLGGAVLPFKAIRADVLKSDYGGYLAGDIEIIGRKQEPQRSAAIIAMRQKIEAGLRKDISIYRQCARELSAYRLNGDVGKELAACADIHVSMSLKFSHIYNGFANLKTLEALPEQQLDMFGT